MTHSESVPAPADLDQVERHLAAPSNGKAVRVTAADPLFGPPPPKKALRPTAFVPALPRRHRFPLSLIAVGWATSFVCIGSHYAVRTRALRDIGGLGPEPPEDFSTTYLRNSAGWHGAFAIDAGAHDDEPLSFADMITPEYQWSRSLTTMLLGLLPRHPGRLPALLRLRLRFAYAPGYHPLLGPTVSAVRPPAAPLLSREGRLFSLTRWPFVPRGLIAAALSGVALYGEPATPSAGYVSLCLTAATSFAVVAVAVPVLHLREAARAARAAHLPVTRVRGSAGLALALVLLAALPVGVALVGW